MVLKRRSDTAHAYLDLFVVDGIPYLAAIAPTVLAIFFIIFVSAIRDMGTTILLVTKARTRSLSVLMLEYSRGGHLEVASIVGVIIAVLPTAVAYLACRLGLNIGVE